MSSRAPFSSFGRRYHSGNRFRPGLSGWLCWLHHLAKLSPHLLNPLRLGLRRGMNPQSFEPLYDAGKDACDPLWRKSYGGRSPYGLSPLGLEFLKLHVRDASQYREEVFALFMGVDNFFSDLGRTNGVIGYQQEEGVGFFNSMRRLQKVRGPRFGVDSVTPCKVTRFFQAQSDLQGGIAVSFIVGNENMAH